MLSLIVPCYNVAPWIDLLLESVQGQTLTNFEVIAVNDGSTDATQERLVEWAQKDPRIRVLNQQNSGPHQARLAGIAQARADWITFADGDDVLLPSHLENLWLGVAENVGVVVGGIREVKPNGAAFDYGPSEGVMTAEAALIGLLIGRYTNGLFVCWNKLYRRGLLMGSGLEGLKTNYGEDVIFNLRVFRAAHEKGFFVIGRPTPTYVYIHRTGSIIYSMSEKHVEDFSYLWAERERFAAAFLPTGDKRWEIFAERRRRHAWYLLYFLARLARAETRASFGSRGNESVAAPVQEPH